MIARQMLVSLLSHGTVILEAWVNEWYSPRAIREVNKIADVFTDF